MSWTASLGERLTLLLQQPTAEKRVGVLTLVVIGFFWISGGIYGNETLVSSAPPLTVLIWMLAVALFFALPIALITAELATAFPYDGGMVVWTEEACGARVGWHNYYWVWITNLFDAAVYPQIAAKYVGGVLAIGHAGETAVALGIVVLVAATNCAGLDWVTASQSVVFVLSLAPSLIFIALGLGSLEPGAITATSGDTDWALLTSWAIWLYSGFTSLGTMAGEVDRPSCVYPCVVAILLPLITALNVLPFAIALSLDDDRSKYSSGFFGTLAGLLAGPWLQGLFVLGANLSQIGLYHSQVTA